MADNVEMSLDDIIKVNKQAKRGRSTPYSPGFPYSQNQRFPSNRFGGGINRGRSFTGIARQQNPRFHNDPRANGGPPSSIGSFKLMVSNLDFSVSDNDIKELFAEFGNMKKAAVHYDSSGRSLGTADIIFERRMDAIKAIQQYNGVPLDGRPMSIQLVTSSVSPGVPPGRSFGPTQSYGNNRQGAARGFHNNYTRGRGGGQGGRGGGQGRRQEKPDISVDKLNAELDAYTMQS